MGRSTEGLEESLWLCPIEDRRRLESSGEGMLEGFSLGSHRFLVGDSEAPEAHSNRQTCRLDHSLHFTKKSQPRTRHQPLDARLDRSMLIPRTLWRAIAKRYRPSQQPTVRASLSKNPGDCHPSSQSGVLLRCVCFYSSSQNGVLLHCVSFYSSTLYLGHGPIGTRCRTWFASPHHSAVKPPATAPFCVMTIT